MEINENLQKYAELAVKSGVNLQKGQTLVVSCPVECAYFAEIVAKAAFEAGAKDVVMNWNDDNFSRVRYDYAAMSQYENVPKWQAEMMNGYAEECAAFLHIVSANPDVFSGIDPKKPAIWRKAFRNACKLYSEKLDVDACTWCILAIPTPVWAKKVFPELCEKDAMDRLWTAILKAARVDTKDPIAAWEEHKISFRKRVNWLNGLDIKEFHLVTERGTDLRIGMPEGYRFEGGGANSTDGLYFFPNIPTEEIFCTPHRLKVNGHVVNALPLIYQGTMIDNFSLTLIDGKIVDYTAEKGYETLRELIETDEGSHYLGEIALVPNKSPISDMGILFYNTLFDENASCHIAIGLGFPACVKGGVEASAEERLAMGINYSATHVDFMIGTAKTEITAVTKTGETVVIFEAGNFKD